MGSALFRLTSPPGRWGRGSSPAAAWINRTCPLLGSAGRGVSAGGDRPGGRGRCPLSPERRQALSLTAYVALGVCTFFDSQERPRCLEEANRALKRPAAAGSGSSPGSALKPEPAVAGVGSLPVGVATLIRVFEDVGERTPLFALTLAHDSSRGCLTLDGIPSIWPAGTQMSTNPVVVTLPEGATAAPGDELTASGGYRPVSAIIDPPYPYVPPLPLRAGRPRPARALRGRPRLGVHPQPRHPDPGHRGEHPRTVAPPTPRQPGRDRLSPRPRRPSGECGVAACCLGCVLAFAGLARGQPGARQGPPPALPRPLSPRCPQSGAASALRPGKTRSYRRGRDPPLAERAGRGVCPDELDDRRRRRAGAEDLGDPELLQLHGILVRDGAADEHEQVVDAMLLE